MPNRVTPKEAAALVADGYAYLDVRSIPEYQQGHPKDAYNIPFMHHEAGRMVLNGDFMAVMERLFQKDAKIVVGCKSGGRSLQAASLLERIGYRNVVDMKGGFDGEMNPHTGQMGEAGWSRVGLPVEAETTGKSYAELLATAKKPA
jgi:rhodanese-related sulfurtransferase